MFIVLDQTPAWKQSPTERREPPHNRPVEMPTNSRNIMSAQVKYIKFIAKF